MDYLIYEYTGVIIFLLGILIYSCFSIIYESIYYIYKNKKR